ncbi:MULTISPECIES: hypothetical protein [Mycolicibacterium]|uniref:hypothetical protein n=1 Tax=Mycolicibacterium TaxID=1866885 RepID=UPI000A6FCAF9|nr:MULTISPECIES: hypothetical protein [Mycolicibacterium]
MSHPHVDQLDRDAIDDLGLVEDDNTPDMRTPPAATRGDLNGQPTLITEQES